jgi:putative membrane protein
MKTLLIAAAAAAAALSACSSMPTGAAAPIAAAAVDQAPPAGMDYVRMAGASDLYEIQSSQVLLQSSQNEELRRFAQMMIRRWTLARPTWSVSCNRRKARPVTPCTSSSR